MTIKQIRKQVDSLRGEQKKTKRDLEAARKRKKEHDQLLADNEQARELIRTAGQKTQQALAFHISDITSLALEAVFKSEAYNLEVEFVQRRNKTECDLWFERDGEKFNPMLASGVGTIDVASFALRVANWSMLRPRNRRIIILDEPMRYLSTDLQGNASEMIKEISQKLGIQFLIITHEEELTEAADRIFSVRKKKKHSIITV